MTALEGGLKRAFESSVALSVLLIVFGVLAVILPIVSSIGITILIGWLVVFAGIAQLGHAFQSENVDQTLWMLMLSIYYLTAGAYLLTGPDLGIVGLTLVLGIFLAAEGLFDQESWRIKVDAAGWRRHSDCGRHDLGSLAPHFVVGDRDPGRHQHGNDRHDPPHDDFGRSQLSQSSGREFVSGTGGMNSPRIHSIHPRILCRSCLGNATERTSPVTAGNFKNKINLKEGTKSWLQSNRIS